MAEYKPCYGKMFPDVIAPVETGHHSGTVFSFVMESFGLTRGKRKVDAALDAWEEWLLAPIPFEPVSAIPGLERPKPFHKEVADAA